MSIYLTDLQENDQAEIAIVCECKHTDHCEHNNDCYSKRLADLGLIPNTIVKIIRRGLGHGPVEIQFRNNNIVLGYGLASKIKVTKISEK